MVRSIHLLRGVAILFIVIGHTLFSDTEVSEGRALVLNFFKGGTVLFVFISGFLFERVFLKRFDYKTFATRRLSKLLQPYLLISLPAIFLVATFYPEATHMSFGPENGEGLYVQTIRPLMIALLTGTYLSAYWYVPFAVLLFLCAPLHVLYARQSLPRQFIILAPLFALALVLQRPSYNMMPPQSMVYLTPVYLLGITVSAQWDSWRPYIRKSFAPALAAAALLTVAQVQTGHVGNYYRDPLGPLNGVDLMLLQKLCLTFGLLGLLEVLSEKRHALLDVLAEYSFGMFFLHFLVILVLYNELGAPAMPRQWMTEALFVTEVVLGTLLLSVVLKRLLGRNSYRLIGC